MTQKLTITVQREADTPHCVRYRELRQPGTDNGRPHLLKGAFYLRQDDAHALGFPAELTITIEPAS